MGRKALYMKDTKPMGTTCLVPVAGILKLVFIDERKSETAFTRRFILDNTREFYVEKYAGDYYVYPSGKFSDRVLIKAMSYRKAFLAYIASSS